MSAVSKDYAALAASTSTLLESSMMEGDELYDPTTVPIANEEWSKKGGTSNLCRICANTSDYFIPIFEGEGLEHQLSEKIDKHLPIKVCDSDSLPIHVCYQCASTLIAWHDLLLNCVEAEKKLLQIQRQVEQDDLESKVIEFDGPSMDSDTAEDSVEPTTPLVTPEEMEKSAPSTSKKNTSIKERPSLKRSLAKKSSSGQKKARKTEPEKSPVVPEDGSAEETAVGRWPRSKRQHSSTRWKTLEDSMDIKIEEQTNHNCDYCHSLFAGKRELGVHLASTHSKLVFHCDKCNEVIVDGSKSEFVKHMQDHGEDVKHNQPLCHKSFPLKSIRGLPKTVKTVVREKNFNCDTCGKCFVRKFDMERHSKIHRHIHKTTVSNNSYSCPFCDEILNKKTDLRKHIHTFHDSKDLQNMFAKKMNKESDDRLSNTSESDENKIPEKLEITKQSNSGLYRCGICLKSYSRKYDLKKHQCKHSEEEKPRACKEKVLVDEDGDYSYLLSHTKLPAAKGKSSLTSVPGEDDSLSDNRVMVGDVAFYRCDNCNKHFHSRYLFVRHRRIHTGEKPFTCHVCGKQFRITVQLNRHIRDVHEGIKNYPCDICGRKFANSHARNDHRRIHTGERPCVCHLCGKAFKTKASLFVHSKFHVDVFPHKCSHCERGFRMRQQLNSHVLLHTGEKPHICQFCSKSFRLSKTLKDHVLIHVNKGSYECAECGKHFAQERYLKNHARSHRVNRVQDIHLNPDTYTGHLLTDQ